jgi:hypothetical protein
MPGREGVATKLRKPSLSEEELKKLLAEVEDKTRDQGSGNRDQAIEIRVFP